ncbi:uncharacterized protein MELLADRAFT_106051 [Melampsora larici-populina 98AG31]|uniref:Uncharacterized protein n=1 Tax=Melampsora larici-populina (strain 98AG31 / pathotype 3-4-7) TaxID=747676 RepID=F4RK75_MELLP|nr:uncharacterized protein MELLADRAFT_106051 [Melampsora larici-populina 98AG31]EGG07233.1 hypothetical protein MELLADRAFT_106051 [Melampsora larici-populina 98AG31]
MSEHVHFGEVNVILTWGMIVLIMTPRSRGSSVLEHASDLIYFISPDVAEGYHRCGFHFTGPKFVREVRESFKWSSQNSCVVSCCLGAITPSERLVEGVIEENDFNSLGASHNERSTPNLIPTMESNRIEEDVYWTERRNVIRLAHEGYEGDKKFMDQRINALKIFAPLAEDLECYVHPKASVSGLSQQLIGFFNIGNRKNELLHIAHEAQRYHSGISPLAKELKLMVYDYKIGNPLYTHGLALDKIIITSLEYLERDNLELYERLWILSVLHILKSFLPKGQLGRDPNTGSVCRGGLELFLTEESGIRVLISTPGLDLKPRVKGISSRGIDIFPVDESITEALKRVELIANIRNYLQDSERNQQTPTFIRIHNGLLQNKSLTKGRILESLALQAMHHSISKTTSEGEIQCLHAILQHLRTFYPVTKKFLITEALKRVELIEKIRDYLRKPTINNQSSRIIEIYDKLLQNRFLTDAIIVHSLTMKCIQHMVFGTTPDQEIQCLYHILQYLRRFYPAADNLVKPWLSRNKRFKAIHHRFQAQAELQPHIQNYLKKADMDPYIAILLGPFTHHNLVDLDYIKRCLHACHLHDYELKEYKSGFHGLDAIRQQKYYEDQDFFIDMIYKAGFYIKGLQEYLNSNGHYEFISKLSLEMEKDNSDKCPICFSEFFEGQRVVKLTCRQMLHGNCMDLTRSDVPHVAGVLQYHFLKISSPSGGHWDPLTRFCDIKMLICRNRFLPNVYFDASKTQGLP